MITKSLLMFLIMTTAQDAQEWAKISEWATTAYVGDIEVMSQAPLDENRLLQLQITLEEIDDIFHNRFELTAKDICEYLAPVKLRIVPTSMIRNDNYFMFAGPTSFGRYFPSVNTIFISAEMFEHPEWLAHEMAHYYYDECRTLCKPAREEMMVYRFQDIYKYWLDNPKQTSN